VWSANPFTVSNVMAGLSYAGTIATNASDLDADALTFAKVSGPSWLNVAANGVLSGRPLSSDVGPNSFLVSVTDPGGLSSTVTMNLTVLAAPPIFASLISQPPNLLMNWTGGVAPYQILVNTDLTTTYWVGLSGPINTNAFSIPPTNPTAFYRILGQ
jgi:hypothetical protein